MNDSVTSCVGSIILFEQEADNMVSDWIDQIKVSRTTRGAFSVTARKYTDDAGQVRHRRWVVYERHSAIKAVKELLVALETCEESLGINLDWTEVISKLATLDWVTAAVIAVARGLEITAIPSIDVLLRQRSLRSLGKVLISVEWGYDMHDISISLEQWIRILQGERYEASTGYYYEGEQFTANWRFDINEADELYVGYDDGGVGWVGNLTSIHVIEGPKILDVDIAKVALQSIEQDSLA